MCLWFDNDKGRRAFQWNSSLTLHIKQHQARILLHPLCWPQPQILLKTPSFFTRYQYTVFYFLPNIHFSSALYFFSQIMDRYLICMDHQLFGRKGDCYCIFVQSKSQSGPVLFFFPELLQQQVNNHNIPHFAPVWILHLPLYFFRALERFIINFSIETRELQHSWNLDITHRIIHFIWRGNENM